MDVATASFSNIADSPKSISACFGLVVRLSLIFSIMVIVGNNSKSPYGSDLYNLAIVELVFLSIAILNLTRLRPKIFQPLKIILVTLFLVLPVTQMILAIVEGEDHYVEPTDYGIAIATLSMAIIYIIF